MVSVRTKKIIINIIYRTFIKCIDNSEVSMPGRPKYKKNIAECLYYFIILKIFKYFNLAKVKKLHKKC